MAENLERTAQEKEGEIERENKVIKDRAERALSDQETREKVLSDFTTSFTYVGLPKEKAEELSRRVIDVIASPVPMKESEAEVRKIFEDYPLNGKSFIENVTEKFTGRAELIHEQVAPYLKDAKGKIIDYGAGNGQVTQLLHDNEGLDIEGVDVSDFRFPGVTIPITIYNGHHVAVPDQNYEAAVMTNVAHHEKDNEKILEELTRIVKNRLVVIETVPIGKTDEEIEKDRERTFMTDVFWNRYFWDANIPVPGTYETPKGWEERFGRHGWKILESRNLGVDQPIVQDTHHLLVMEKEA
jgi:ubiquinone/menaquinone biosynthesis C-methylase UbiE